MATRNEKAQRQQRRASIVESASIDRWSASTSHSGSSIQSSLLGVQGQSHGNSARYLFSSEHSGYTILLSVSYRSELESRFAARLPRPKPEHLPRRRTPSFPKRS
eukprot:scaffold735_cov255-Pinguiococcus_pyrenoidosus.AAC.5